MARQDSSPRFSSRISRGGESPVLTHSATRVDSSLPKYDRYGSDIFLSTIQEESTTEQADEDRPAPPSGQDLSSSNELRKKGSPSGQRVQVAVDLMHELGPTEAPPPGSHNPLAYIADLKGEREVRTSLIVAHRFRELDLSGSPTSRVRSPRGDSPSVDPNLTPSDDGSMSQLLPGQEPTHGATLSTTREKSPLAQAQQTLELPQPRKEPPRATHSSPLHRELVPVLSAPLQSPEDDNHRKKPVSSELQGKRAVSAAVLTSEEVDRAFDTVDSIVRNVVLEARNLHPSPSVGSGQSTSQQDLKRDSHPAERSSRHRHSLPDLEPVNYLPAGTYSRHHLPTATKQEQESSNSGSRRAVRDTRTKLEVSPPTSPSYPVQSSKSSRRLSTDNSDSGRESMTFDPEPAATAIEMESACYS